MSEIINFKVTIYAILAASLLHTDPVTSNKLHSTSVALVGQQTSPTSGKLVKLTTGDLMCYVDLIDAGGHKHQLGADFSVCERPKLLNKQVKLTYRKIKINDCQSNEPCGKTRIENAIVKMELLRKK